MLRTLKLLYTRQCWACIYVFISVLILQHLIWLVISLTWWTTPEALDGRRHTHNEARDAALKPQLQLVDSALSILQSAHQGKPQDGARVHDVRHYSRHCQVYDVVARQQGEGSIREQWQPKQEVPQFRLYVYELPAEFNADLVSCINRKYTDGCFDVDFCGAGVRLGNYSQHLFLHDTWQFSLEVMLHHKLLYSPYRTFNASQADVFYVPYYPALDCFCNSGTDKVASNVAKLFKYLRTTGYFKGIDTPVRKPHLMTLGKIEREHFSLGCPLLRHPDARGLILAGIEEEGPRTRRSIERSIGLRPMIVMPYPSYGHLNSFSTSVPFLLDLKTTRTVFLFLAAGRRRSNRFRAAILDQFKDVATSHRYPEVIDTRELNSRFMDATRSGGVPRMRDKVWLVTDECRGNHKYHTLQWMQHSVFCLQPPGDSPTRKSFYDALISGCIPVLFDGAGTGKTRYPFAGRLNYTQFTVTVPPPRRDSVDIKNFLRLIPEGAVKRMRREVFRVSRYLQYSLPITNGPHTDAVQYMLDEVYNRHLQQ